MSPELVNGLFGIAGAVVGALAGGAIALYSEKKNRVRKELTVALSYPSRLVEVDAQAPEIEIRVGGKTVASVYLVDVSLLNTGNEVLMDISAPVKFNDTGTEIVAVTLRDPVSPVPDEGIDVTQTNSATMVISSKFLNPGESVTARAMMSGRPMQFKVLFRQPGVATKIRIDRDVSMPDVMSRAMFDAIRRNPILHSYLSFALPAYRRYVEYVKQEDDRSKELQRSLSS